MSNLIGSSTEEKIWNYLYSKLHNAYGVAGIMGNMYAESGLQSTNLQNTYEKKLGYTDAQYTQAVDNGTYTNFIKDCAGYGLVQWTYWTLKQDLYNYAKSKNTSIGDLEMQLEFLCKELQEQYSYVWNICKAATSVATASNAMLLKFERPADQSQAMQNKRASYGQNFYNKYTKQTTTSTNTSTTTAKVTTDVATGYNKSIAGTYKTTATLNLRKGASTSKAIITTIPNQFLVNNYGYYSLDKNGIKWLYIQFTYQGVTYTGFSSSQYLKKQ